MNPMNIQIDVIRGWTELLNPSRSMTQEEKDEKLKSLMAGYVATTDVPAIFFVEELCRLYPEAIVICSVRDMGTWWDSYAELTARVEVTQTLWVCCMT